MDNDLLKDLNEEQKKAVTFGDGPLLIVAGAGTGKTTVITKRLAWLVASGKAKTEEILTMTFTDKAAGEMEERVDKLLPYGYLDLWISTFHAFAERILKDNALEIGIPNDFRLLNQTEQWLLVRKNLDRFNLDYYRPMGNPTKFIHALVKHFSRAKDEAVSPAEYLEYVENLKLNTDSTDFTRSFLDEEIKKSLTKKEIRELAGEEIKKLTEVANAYHVYQQLLLENNSLDFGDLINYCLDLFRKRPLILNKYRQQFKYILVDEFQDTNWAQYELIKMLAAPKNNLTVVGDDDQSIYKFRGASVSNILEFKQDFKKAKEIFLNQNYRSTQDILDFSYKFIKQNDPNRLEAKLGKAKKFSKKLLAQNKGGGLLEHFHAESAKDEVKIILKQIIDLKNKDKEATWNDFAILVRANDSASPFIYGLTEAGLPFQFIASRGLYAKPIILDILSYLKLLDNYHESTALYRIINLPLFGFEYSEIVNFNNWSYRKGCSLYETLTETVGLGLKPEIQEKIKKVLDLIAKHSQLAREGTISQVIFAFLEESGYLKELIKKEGPKTQEATRFLNQFFKKIEDFENSFEDRSVKNFLLMIGLELEAGEEGALENNPEEGPESVKVMTIHAAKGLEFKYVFVPVLVDRRFPTTERKDPIELPSALIKEIVPEGDIHLEEERRLFYVAMTRAKKGLFFSSADDYGGQRKKKLSRFLFELRDLGFTVEEETKTALPILRKEKAEKIREEFSARGGSAFGGKKEELEVILSAKFSFTQLKAFENCPYQYRFAHILRIPVRGKGIFSFGKTIHQTLQKFFLKMIEKNQSQQGDLFSAGPKTESKIAKKSLISLEELWKIYENSWIDDWYTTRTEQSEYKEKGKKVLKEFYSTLPEEIVLPKYLERAFYLKLKSNGQEFTIKGVIDRVDELGDGIEIIDYKTGEGKTEEKLRLEDKEQLLIYQIAAGEVFNEKVKNLSYYYIEANRKLSFLGTDEELKKLKEKIIKTIEEIKKDEFSPKPSMLCKYCDFKNICEYRQL
jgi:DNA helicase-2/ATP-dependent DNA helicase PcrA